MNAQRNVSKFNARTAQTLLLLACLPAGFAAAQEDRSTADAERTVIAAPVPADEALVEEGGGENAADDTGVETHATHEASAELVALAARERERFIGKTLLLDDGNEAITVGPILEIRKRILDQEPYVIVDASEYFNAPTTYAVSVVDLDRIDGDNVIMPEIAGMHLRGLDYYPEDFVELEDTSPEAVLADNVDLSETPVAEESIDPHEEADDLGDAEDLDQVPGIEEPVNPEDAGVKPLLRF